jgi:hypothetical protein
VSLFLEYWQFPAVNLRERSTTPLKFFTGVFGRWHDRARFLTFTASFLRISTISGCQIIQVLTLLGCTFHLLIHTFSRLPVPIFLEYWWFPADYNRWLYISLAPYIHFQGHQCPFFRQFPVVKFLAVKYTGIDTAGLSLVPLYMFKAYQCLYFLEYVKIWWAANSHDWNEYVPLVVHFLILRFSFTQWGNLCKDPVLRGYLLHIQCLFIKNH